MEIICLSGYARSGKDEAAHILAEHYGFKHIAFADKLRDVLYALNPLVGTWRAWDAEPGEVLLQDAIDVYGWSGYKESIYGPEIRRLLQRLGTEAGRETLWDSIWIDAALKGLVSERVVISDGRFFNEFDAVRSRGGDIWRIERPGIGPVTDHPSETQAPKYKWFEKTLHNDGTLEEYQLLVRKAYEGRD